ncbi:MAG: hypothetical protein AAGD25_20650 [Cyanobacteria bacterium P01_F01_bin.150]
MRPPNNFRFRAIVISAVLTVSLLPAITSKAQASRRVEQVRGEIWYRSAGDSQSPRRLQRGVYLRGGDTFTISRGDWVLIKGCKRLVESAHVYNQNSREFVIGQNGFCELGEPDRRNTCPLQGQEDEIDTLKRLVSKHASTQELDLHGPYPSIISPRGYVTAADFNSAGEPLDSSKLLLQWERVPGARRYRLQLLSRGDIPQKYILEGTETQIEFPFDVELEEREYLLIVEAEIESDDGSTWVSSIQPENIEGDISDLYVSIDGIKGFVFEYRSPSVSENSDDGASANTPPPYWSLPELNQEGESENEGLDSTLIRAIQYFHRGYFSQALQKLNQFESPNSNLDYINYLRGRAAAEIGLLRQATNYYRSINTDNLPDDLGLQVFLNLADLKLISNEGSLEDILDKINSLHESLGSNSNLDDSIYAQLTLRLGLLYIDLGQEENAKPLLGKAYSKYSQIRDDMKSLNYKDWDSKDVHVIVNCLKGSSMLPGTTNDSEH